MRKNLFLHFLNRDSREIFGLYDFHGDINHTALLKQCLNAAIVLSEDHCVIPPGFAIEDSIAFGLSEVNRHFFAEKRILLPMRETNLSEYAEKKRIEYSPQRDRYSGLYNDRRLAFLGEHATGIIPRRSRISEEIVNGWEAAADSKSRRWNHVKKLLVPAAIELIRQVPGFLISEGLAVTWAEISSRLPDSSRAVHSQLRGSLQHVYLKQYCGEFNLEVLCELPLQKVDEFGLPCERLVYNFTRFSTFLASFYLRKLLLGCSAETLCEIKNRPGLTRFVDAYQGVARMTESRAGLMLIADNALRACRFNWRSFEARHSLLVAEPDGLALEEMNDALLEAASILTSQNGVPVRWEGAAHSVKAVLAQAAKDAGAMEIAPMPDVVFYVALQEELDVLVRDLKLKKSHTGQAALGAINGFDVAVLSPASMGRVPAAVEVTRYLERRKDRKPKLIFVVGLAGGFEEENAQPGEVLCATTVVDLASRKVQDKDQQTRTRFRRKDFNLDGALGKVLQSSFEMKKWQDKAIKLADWPEGRRPSLRYGLIASVDEVIASDAWRKTLVENTDKLLGVEMEAGGVCAAAEIYKVPVVMLRVVSDNADPIKADTAWRKCGMKTIVCLLKMLDLNKVIQALNP